MWRRRCACWEAINVSKLLTIVYLLELIAGAKEFNLGFSGMSMTPEQMTSNLKVRTRRCESRT